MSESPSVFGRIGQWLRGPATGGHRGGGATSMEPGMQSDDNQSAGDPSPTAVAVRPSSGSSSTPPVRGSIFRPFAKRDAAIANMQEGIGALAGLMDTIRQNLEKQSVGQQELLGYLSHLPDALQGIPEANRVHGETLKAIHGQIAHQNGQHEKLSEILERLVQADQDGKEASEHLRDRVEGLHRHDAHISSNLLTVGSAMQSVSASANESAKMLETLREKIDNRDAELREMVTKQNSRFAAMMAAAIVLSIGAFVAVGVIAYFGWQLARK